MSSAPEPWRVVDSETLVADRWIRVRADDCRASEAIAVHVVSLDGLGDHLAQSYHQLTWYKAMELLDR